MSHLNRRTQILLDEDRYRRLERRASDAGSSVAAIIREAIDEKLAHDDRAAGRAAAARDFLGAATPDYAAEPDWASVKGALRDR